MGMSYQSANISGQAAQASYARDNFFRFTKEVQLRLNEYNENLGNRGTPVATIYFPTRDGPLRTLIGNSHQHAIGLYASAKMGVPQPYEGLAEFGVVEESELRAKVIWYQTQAFRLEMWIDGEKRTFIVDHLRETTEGVEAIEVKQHPGQLNEKNLPKYQRAREILMGIGVDLKIRYEDEIEGSETWRYNRKTILMHRSVSVSEEQMMAFERLRAITPETTLGEVRAVLDPRKIQGRAAANALICRGRILLDLQSYVSDFSPVTLVPARHFQSRSFTR